MRLDNDLRFRVLAEQARATNTLGRHLLGTDQSQITAACCAPLSA
jgi:hypothetical protein